VSLIASIDWLPEWIAKAVWPGVWPNAGTETMPAFFDNGVTEENRYVGEDFIFCRRVREAGGTVWGCPWLRITHSGTFDFVGNLPRVVAL